MRALVPFLTLLLAACTQPSLTPPLVTLTATPPAPCRNCPDAPGVELYEDSPPALGEPFGVGGHVLSLVVSRDDDDHRSLVGTLDVKGTLALERHTRALALATYAATQRSEPPRRMTLALHGRPIAGVAVTSAMRGERFRVPLLDVTFSDDTETELRDALRIDRRCFPGR